MCSYSILILDWFEMLMGSLPEWQLNTVDVSGRVDREIQMSLLLLPCILKVTYMRKNAHLVY